MNTRWTVCALLLAARSVAGAATLPLPLDINALVKDDKARVSATEFDIGGIASVFDADRATVARTPSINPAFVQVVFSEPRTIIGIRVTFTADRHEWTVKAGDDDAPARIVASGTFRGDDPRAVMFDKPLTARSFRLDVRRTEGDDYVHVKDWELLQPGEVTALEVSRTVESRKRIADDALMENTVVALEARAKTPDGRMLDVTRDVRWTAEGAQPWPPDANRFHIVRPGVATFTAVLGDLSGSVSIEARPYAFKGNGFDLDVLYIERTPRMDYDSRPATGGWPEEGERVGWVAHLRNWGDRDVDRVDYLWVLDGVTVHRGAIRDWKAGTDARVAFPWRWKQERHELAFVLDASSAWPEEASKANNQVTVFTDALAVGYWVEDELWRYFHEHQHRLDDGMNSFEDWGQRQMNRWNEMFAGARFGTAPRGVTDRVRLDLVVRVPNGALPLSGGLPTNNPDRRDKTVDLMWGMVSADMGPGRFWEVQHGRPFHLEYGLIHELNHARYLVDSYGFDVHSQSVESIVGTDGAPLLGTPAMPGNVPAPGQATVVRYNKYRGMMGGPHYVSEHEAYGWNRVAGQRARQGNQNGPGDIGVYLEDLPRRNHMRFVDETGAPIAGAAVELHQARPMKDVWYGKTYVPEPDARYTTDTDGWITLPRNPFGEKIIHGYGHANTVLLFVVKRGDIWRTAFQEVTDFNLQFARGQTEDAYYQMRLDFTPRNTTLGVTSGLTGR